MKQETITYKELTLPIIRSDRKSIGIKMEADGSFTIRAPFGIPKEYLLEAVKQDYEWIEKHRALRLEQSKKSADLGDAYTEAELQELARKATEWLPGKVREWASVIGVSYKIPIKIQPMTSRWGSCSKDGNLKFNVILMEAPERVRESVVVHELCHIGVMNHSKDFYDRLYSVFPDYDECRKWLKQEGMLYIRRLS